MADELPTNCHTPVIAECDDTTDPQEYLSRFENAALLHRYTNGIKCRVFITTFARAAQQWFNQLPVGAIGSSKKDNELLKEYLQIFNTVVLEVPSATQEVKASAFSQGLSIWSTLKLLRRKVEERKERRRRRRPLQEASN
ncbi:UNVERIFIED_CONTAM: hypothetical protein Slati_1457100 [Sesamum latifolium]|uniref:Retrotransposon gag domain-containing protein n=1 Tax=Sesamum latifolium TaxID=2727402 RepID=A0AAW2X490_9LAMI